MSRDQSPFCPSLKCGSHTKLPFTELFGKRVLRRYSDFNSSQPLKRETGGIGRIPKQKLAIPGGLKEVLRRGLLR